MDSDLDLSALRTFRAVVRTGSFARAAIALRAPKSTVSKRVADLEAALGVRLIERTTRQLRVTAEGEVLAARADRLLAEAEDIRRSLSEQGGTPRGPLRIAVPSVMGHVLMGGIAARFRSAYPEITLEVHFLDRPADLLDEGFDGAIRFGPLEDSGQVARLITQAHAIVAASPALAGLDRLTAPDGLRDMPLVGMVAAWPGAWTLEDSGGAQVQLSIAPQLLLGSFLAVRDAIAAGAGVGLLPALLAAPDLASGQLVRVLPGWATPRRPIHFVYPSAQSVTARLRVFIDFMADALRGATLDRPFTT